MKKLFIGLSFVVMFMLCNFITVFAGVGQMGFFGGINEGKRLPKTTEVILDKIGTAKKNTSETTVYKEVIFLSGKPVEFEGQLTVTASGGVADDKDAGTYKVTYDVRAGAIKNDIADITRNIVFNVNYRRENKQIVKDYAVIAWKETIKASDGEYTVDPKQSHFDVSVLEDITAGVTYYKGDVSIKTVYLKDKEDKTVVETTGSLYGYDCAWSSTETHILDTEIYTDVWQMQYQTRPSVSVNKILQYSQNQPTAISFAGNYREVMSNRSGMQYNIFLLPQRFYGTPTQGGIKIDSYNSFEQLIAPDTAFLKGHSAQSDIEKLFAMGILSDEPKQYQPSQAITRAQFVTMLAKAIKLPVDLPQAKSNARKNVAVNIVFPDVSPERQDYPYIMSAYKAGLAVGRGNGHFYADYTIQREEALVILLRTLGLSNLGLDPTPITPFVDDAKVSAWAKKDLYAAYKLGLIKPDDNGNINPSQSISKAEAAALVNLLVEYMRTGIQTDYTEHIINYVDMN